MAYAKADFDNDVKSINVTAIKGLNDVEREFDDYKEWLDSVRGTIKSGSLSRGYLLPKTPAKKRGALGTINESVSNISQLGSPEIESIGTKQLPKKKSRQTRGKRKQDQSTDIEEIVEEADDSLSKRRKRDVNVEPKTPLGDDCSVEDSMVSMPSEIALVAEPERETTQRRTRSHINKITVVQESRQTFVIETVAKKSKSVGPPVLKSLTPVRVSENSSEDVFKSPLPFPETSVPSDEASPSPGEKNPPQRITRTKTRAMAKAKQTEKAKSPAEVPKTSDPGYTSGHESDDYTLASTGSGVKPAVASFLKQKLGTPVSKTFYASSSHLGTPTASNLLTSVHSFITKPAPASIKKVREEDYIQKLNQKTAEAVKKREELIKAQTEEKMRKRQEKTMKVNAAREAMEKERAEKLRLQMIQEEQKLKEELAKRRKLQQQKAAEERKRKLEEAERLRKEEAERERLRKEAEERERLRREEAERERLRKEEAERERLRKLSEERERLRKEAEERERLRREEAERERLRKEAEERERIRKEEAERERIRKEAEKVAAAKAAKATKQLLNETYDMTPMPANREPSAPKNADDYGIEDARCDDSSDDESNPKKQVPAWAEPRNRLRHLTQQCDYMSSLARIFFDSKKTTPDLSKMFKSIDRRLLIRKSSAVWNTPPIKYNRDP